MLSRMADFAESLASGFHAQGIAALAAGDLDRAGTAETRFSSLFLGIRRALALKAKLRQQREEAQRKAAVHKDRRQDEKDDRRQAVAEGLSRAIAAGKPGARERLTTGLWEKLTENERIDADLADTALPIETLILRLGRDIGLSRRALAAGLDPAAAKAGTDQAGPKASGGSPFVPPAGCAPLPDPEEEESTKSMHICCISAADLGLPGDEPYRVRIDTGEVFDNNDDDDVDIVIMRLPVPDHPWRADAPDVIRRSARATAAERAVPPEPRPPPPLDPEEAEFQRQAAYAKQHSSFTLLRPPALARRLGLPEHGTADGGPAPGNLRAADKGP
ncbi:hypothetical protein [Inquilinus sp. OTU3971]|uniref:hypothetical protein n=1 Tax=Inquilinus sp. OTU3971 TaxID=3043855 RepID=UPI00313EDE0E